MRDTAWTARCFEENRRNRARLRAELARGRACRRDASHANFVLARFRDRAEAEACDRALREAGIIVRRVAGYKLPAALADHRRRRRGLRAGSPRRSAASCGSGRDRLPPRRADRARADRLVDQPRDPADRRAGADHRPRPHGRDPRRGGAARARRGVRRAPATRSRAPTSSSSPCRSGRWPRSPPRSAPRLAPGATLTDVGSVKRAVIEAVAPHVPEGVALRPGAPAGRAPSTRGRGRASRSSSTTAGAC